MTNEEFKIKVVPISKKLYRFADYLLKDKNDAQDIVQEVFIKLWSMINELDNYDSVEALAMRITRNKCTDLLREKTRKYAPSIDEIDLKNKMEQNDEEVVDHESKIKLVKKMIQDLPENYKSIIMLKDIEGYDFDEISEILDLNVNSIRVTLSRARKKLRELINQHYYEYN